MTQDLRSKLTPWLLIIVTPLFFLLMSREWIYPEIWISDSYFNHTYAYFYDIPDFQKYWYKVERASWIIPLYYLRKFVGGYNLMITIGLLSYMVLGALYFLNIKELFSRKLALYNLPFIITYPHLVSWASGGGTYHSYIANIYFLVATLFWIKGLKSETKLRYLLLSGFFVGSTLITSVLFLNLLPLFLILEFVLTKRLRFKPTLISLLGGGISYFFWSIWNLWFGRGWVSFSQRITQIFRHVEPDSPFNSWYYSLESLFFLKNIHAQYIGLFMTVIVAVSLIFIANRKAIERKYFIGAYASFCTLLWFFWHYVGLQSLFPPDFTYPLQIVAFLSLPIFLNDHFVSAVRELFKFFNWGDSKILIFLTSLFALCVVGTSSFRPWLLEFKWENTTTSICILIFGVSLFLFSRVQSRVVIFFGLAGTLFFYSFFYDDYKGISYRQCVLNEEADHTVINLIERLKNYAGKDPRRVFVFYAAQERVPINRPYCNNKDVVLGMMVHHVGYILGGKTFIQPGYDVILHRNALELVDDDFFNRVYKGGGLLFIFSKNNKFYFNGLQTLAKSRGYMIELEDSFKYDFAGNDLTGIYLRVTKDSI